MRRTVDRRGLLARAHVLAQIDSPHIACMHLRDVISQQEQDQANAAMAVNETYLANLRLLHTWLSDPAFLRDPRNEP